jgi:transcriptional regulator with XRE-family HTH domain
MSMMVDRKSRSEQHQNATSVLRLDGAAVRRKRLANAMTQRALARLSRLDVSSISYLERGTRRARVSTIRQIAEALQCEPLDIASIIEEEDEPAGTDRD